MRFCVFEIYKCYRVQLLKWFNVRKLLKAAPGFQSVSFFHFVWNICLFWPLLCSHFFLWMRLNVRFIRGSEIFLRTGRLWYQNVLVGEFMRRRLPWASSSFTGSICRLVFFPRASLCLKIKSRIAPKETEAMGQRGSSSFSSSRCSPMWSSPSLYLVEKKTT